ncbi:hypothetical protein HDU76_006407 [Blyttiomyces sp. JEL0837]|nr:hypothetical protein HDU76_006407 [Blyttiomyces sp. JEL0837]
MPAQQPFTSGLPTQQTFTAGLPMQPAFILVSSSIPTSSQESQYFIPMAYPTQDTYSHNTMAAKSLNQQTNVNQSVESNQSNFPRVTHVTATRPTFEEYSNFMANVPRRPSPVFITVWEKPGIQPNSGISEYDYCY